MTFKSILVPLEESESLDSVLSTALKVAQMFNSHIEGLCIRSSLAGAIAGGVEGGVAALASTEEQFEREQDTRIDRLKTYFDKFVRKNGLSEDESSPIAGPSATWVESETTGLGLYGQYGRFFDLIVVGRPTPGILAPAMNTLETVLFDTGRPVLIAPPTATKTIAKNILVAWNGSSETARAIALAAPMMAGAQRITIVSVEGATVPGPSGTQIAQNLERHGLHVEVINISEKHSPAAAGKIFLDKAKETNADLLIKGGYTQSRLRQMIFGGATNHILNESQVPIFMTH